MKKVFLSDALSPLYRDPYFLSYILVRVADIQQALEKRGGGREEEGPTASSQEVLAPRFGRLAGGRRLRLGGGGAFAFLRGDGGHAAARPAALPAAAHTGVAAQPNHVRIAAHLEPRPW